MLFVSGRQLFLFKHPLQIHALHLATNGLRGLARVCAPLHAVSWGPFCGWCAWARPGYLCGHLFMVKGNPVVGRGAGGVARKGVCFRLKCKAVYSHCCPETCGKSSLGKKKLRGGKQNRPAFCHGVPILPLKGGRKEAIGLPAAFVGTAFPKCHCISASLWFQNKPTGHRPPALPSSAVKGIT